jgi:hypothetical protein
METYKSQVYYKFVMLENVGQIRPSLKGKMDEIQGI